MKKILIATHGTLAEGFASAVEILTGVDSIEYINAYVTPDESDYSGRIITFLDSLSSSDEGIIFTDIFGGSVNQKVVSLVEKSGKKVFIVTQINLPIVLEIVLTTENLSNELIEKFIQNSNVRNVDLAELETEASSEEDFFN